MNVCYDIMLKYAKDKEVLDIGSCGEQGGINKPKLLYSKLKEAAKSIQGVDIESDSEEIIRGNAETIQLNKQFDLITAGDVIEHLHNPGLFLSNMHKHLKDNGRLIIVTPNAKSIGYLPFKGNAFHTLWYCQHTLKYILKQHGFKVENIKFGIRKRINPINDIMRNYFANNLMFICKKQ